VVFSWLHTDSLRLDDAYCVAAGIVNHDLRNTLTHLPLFVVHQTASKAVDLALVCSGGVPTPPVDLLVRIYLNVFPR
jgi:hypothetical protein